MPRCESLDVLDEFGMPGLLKFLVEPTRGKTIVFPGQSFRVLTADDLAAIIESHALKERNKS